MSQPTVSTARKKPGDKNLSPAKHIGRNGVEQAATKRVRRPKDLATVSEEQLPEVAAELRAEAHEAATNNHADVEAADAAHDPRLDELVGPIKAAQARVPAAEAKMATSGDRKQRLAAIRATLVGLVSCNADLLTLTPDDDGWRIQARGFEDPQIGVRLASEALWLLSSPVIDDPGIQGERSWSIKPRLRAIK